MENFIQFEESNEKFDTVISFSTSMWIHINFGDKGMIRFFKKVASTLKTNGHFIFEPYEWHSYKKRKNFSEKFKYSIKKIKFKP